MNRLYWFAAASVAAAGMLVGCSDDGDGDNPSGTGATSTGGKGGGTSSSGGKSGGTSSGGDAGDTGSGGTGDTGSGGKGGTAGTGGTSPSGCDVYADKPKEEIPADGNGNVSTTTLTSDKIWTLTGQKYVDDGQVLTIEPCTLIEASPKPNAGSLFVMRGGKIMADGTSDEPIVFTSESHGPNSANPWGGIVLLGKAPIAPTDGTAGPWERIFEGMSDVRASFGGNVAGDSSGSMTYVRIEYGGDIIAGTKEINGLTMAGTGSGTVLNHIMVKDNSDDCFEWFGGTASADHLICQNPGDDMFDTDEGFRGKLQFLFGRTLFEGSTTDPHGFEWDGNKPLPTAADETRSIPQASNVTLCGLNAAGAATSYGVALRSNLMAGVTIQNGIFTGWDNGINTTYDAGTNTPAISYSFFDNQVNDTSGEAMPGDDVSYDEAALVSGGTGNTVGSLPAGFNCYADPPEPPTAAEAGEAPVSGFDTDANFVGAVKDADNNWMTGAWVNWD